jgi:hypothetical protein
VDVERKVECPIRYPFKATGQHPGPLLRSLLAALLDEYEASGKITPPLHVTSKQDPRPFEGSTTTSLLKLNSEGLIDTDTNGSGGLLFSPNLRWHPSYQCLWGPLIHKQSSFICYILFWRFLTEILIAR